MKYGFNDKLQKYKKTRNDLEDSWELQQKQKKL